ncbi:MAG: LptF/LptG family permease [Kiritimatiellae bacterium]|nr:LptF/LptG family permease [Kiritimatiellia bacterium]MCO5062205.1 LptF/LptG family permease [Kiritimatiellia bacterium]MCO5069011.1 LptF/LptG family permease [Kiritimatiellia bacterium]MCO6401602.1 LptF/LptG family permease [Verrucomicrobiota bacterium]
MKLIDRYLLRTFFVPFAYILLAFCMLYVIFDLFDNLGDFIEGNTPFALIFRYYVVLLPSVWVQIVPVSMFLAVLYSLSTLTKSNELTAMRASGISITRLMAPYMAVGLLATIFVSSIHETIGPPAAYWCHNFVREQKRSDPNLVYIKKQIAVKYQRGRRTWLINELDIRTLEMRGVEITQQREDSSDEWRIRAKEARWLDGRWWLRDTVEQAYDKESNPMGPPHLFLTREMPDLKESPDFFLNETKDPEYLTSSELFEYLKMNKRRDPAALARIRADLHFKIAEPWACMIVMLLGIPFGAQTGRKGAMLGVTLSLGLFFSYYVLSRVGLSMAKNMIIPAWLGPWLVNGLYLIIGGYMIRRMR